MSSFIKQYLVILLALLTTRGEAGFSPSKTLVRITNEMDGGLDLTIHCKSRNDDLGAQLLHPQGSFEFHFRVNFWETTQYYCSFHWTGQFQWFDIYIAARDDFKCNECFWKIKQTGPCMMDRVSGII
ncbi:conserved hypothetical protein [Ricinus communis]|uniref:S-protein homolog n=1 Tax=Ricinus communis TaxID=3988 RepID=B9RWN8_RICCO|nr:conserved hypothetical protein [Ricinus communis]